MNDPNGLVFANGQYHLFYQHYPDSTVWGPMHWGHATSSDLIHWKQLPIALYPDSLGMIFSGSAVMDTHNTSGLGTSDNPPIVAIYTYHNDGAAKAGRMDFQTQGMAFSIDNGNTWSKFKANPIIKNPGQKDFRDPKVFWHEPTKKWVLILAAFDHVEIYRSPDLKSWTHVSDFGLNQGGHGGVWECPDLFPLPVEGTQEEKWVMLVSLGDGGINGGSATQYFLGTFDGERFTNQLSKEQVLWIDYGRDNYAGVTWSGTGNKRIFLGWMSNWKYAQVVPTKNWRSAMTIPRELKLINTADGPRIASMPVGEINSLSDGHLPLKLDGTNIITLPSSQIEVTLTIQLPSNHSGFEFELSNAPGEKVLIGLDDANHYYIDRTHAGPANFSTDFPGKHPAPRMITDSLIQLTMLIDRSSVELFADQGLTTMTDLFFPTEEMKKLTLRVSEGVQIVDYQVVEMKRIW
jgi:fructan beta-fructosidase